MSDNPSVARFKALMALLPAKVKADIQGELEKQGETLVSVMKRAAPVKSGKLRDSVRMEKTKGRELSVSVKAGGPTTTHPVRKGATAQYDYSLATEWGTTETGSQPFFYPSYRLRKKPTVAAVKRKMDKSLKANTGNVA
jgi:HK97 gp10 family phage protein